MESPTLSARQPVKTPLPGRFLFLPPIYPPTSHALHRHLVGSHAGRFNAPAADHAHQNHQHGNDQQDVDHAACAHAG